MIIIHWIFYKNFTSYKLIKTIKKLKSLDKLKKRYKITDANLDSKIYMAKNKNCIVKMACSRFCVVALSIAVVGTALGNYSSAADVYPTIHSTQWQQSAKTSISVDDIRSSFTEFVKSGLEKSTSENDYTILLANSDKPAAAEKKTVKESSNTKLSFADIADNEYGYYIEELAQKGIVSTKNDKFYPDNFIRLNELMKMVVNSYRYRVWYSLNSDAGLTDKNYFDAIMPKYYNTAYEMWLMEWLSNIDDYERFVSLNDFETVLKNVKKQYPNLIHLHYYDEPREPKTLRRGYVSKALYRSLMLDIQWNIAYLDSAYHKYGSAIQMLADLWISNTWNQSFYPDQEITRWDFITLLTKTYLKSNNKNLELNNMDFSISDLDYNSQYAKYVLYAKENWFIDYLLESQRWETYIKLNQKISKHEVYHILSEVAWVNIEYDVAQADSESITRWEVAQLLVDSFSLWSKNYRKLISDSQLGRLFSNIKWSIDKGKQLASLL